MTATYPNLIDGRTIDSAERTADINPSNVKDVVGEFARATTAELDQAIASARTAFDKWSRTTPQERFDILDRAATEILARKEELGRLLSREQGKPLADGIGEAARAGYIFKYFAGEALRITGDKLDSVRPGLEVEVTREPVGVVGMITPWNFPLAIPAWKIAPALAFGNCVVFKPAELVPASPWTLVDIIQRAGLPHGVLNLVQGQGSTLGAALTAAPGIDAVTFTGSREVGSNVATSALKNGVRVQLEMGGKNPLVVLDDADMNTAVSVAVNGAFFQAGQRCTASSRIIVTEGIHDRFVQAMVERMKKLVVDDALKAGTEIGPVVDDRQLKKDLEYVEIGKNEGARLVTGGQKLTSGDLARGWFHAPTIFADATMSMRVAAEEIFGPVTTVVPISSLEEGIRVANSVAYGLSGSIYTQDVNKAFTAMREFETGIFYVNSSTIGAEVHLPFGGIKDTGNGHREAGIAGLDVFTEWKSIYVDFSGKLQKAQIDTH